MQRGTLLGLVLTLGTLPVSQADQLLFPVVVSNPDAVVTLITVVNTATSHGRLRYVYFYKAAGEAGECQEYSFVRSTHPGDSVTFDVSGTFGDGEPLNGDADVYEGRFSLPTARTPYRGYLLVYHYDADTGTAVKAGPLTLMGQATLMDINTGSAWGYRGINDAKNDEKPAFDAAVGVTPKSTPVNFSFLPPTDWTTRFFITPVGSDMTNTAGQYSSQATVTIHDQNGSYTSEPITCIGTLDLTEMVSKNTLANIADTGGWGSLTLSATEGNGPAIIFKLDYSFSDSYVEDGHSANNGMLLTR